MMLELMIESAAGALCLALLAGATLVLLRIHNPHLQRLAWSTVLGAALLLPCVMWLMRLQPVALPRATSESVVALVAVVAQRGQESLVSYVYFSISALLLARYGWALLQALRLRRSATAVDRIGASPVRVSMQLGAPVSIGNCILLPADFERWSETQMQAVVAHELSHIRRRDFLLMNLAQLYRALFWFSPLAWWLPRRLALVNEQLSDDAALRAFADRADYARLLLDFTLQSQTHALAVAMARPATVTQRIERILSETDIATPPARVTRALLLAAVLAPTLLIVAQAQGISEALNHPPTSNPAVPLEQPDYPAPSRNGNEQGTVVLSLYVLEDGRVANVEVKESSGYPNLDDAAAQRAYSWRLKPALENGRPVAGWGKFAVTFRLTDD